MSFQTLTLDRLPATHAHAVCAERHALESALDRADLPHVTRDLGEGLILEIADAAGDIGVGLVVGPRRSGARLIAQRAPSLPQLVLEARVLAARGATGAVYLRCDASSPATAMAAATGRVPARTDSRLSQRRARATMPGCRRS